MNLIHEGVLPPDEPDFRDERREEEEARRKREAVGNAAAMREAMDELVANIEMRASAFGTFSIIDRKTFLDAKAALSAPARNCDRPECATSKAAQNVWRKEDGGKTPYYEWLLAPAAERKGATV